MKFLYKTFLSCIFTIAALAVPGSAFAFFYESLPTDNLILNPWFRSIVNPNNQTCEWSLANWQTTPSAPWGPSDKTQDPTDYNCFGDYVGYAARFAKNSGAATLFYPNKNALLYQIVESPNPADRTLHFHSLIVAHRVNQYKATIYGTDIDNPDPDPENDDGVWISVWTPFNIQNCLSTDCVNETYGAASNNDNREGLWDDIIEDILGLEPKQQTIAKGYKYYKIEFLMNYPDPNCDPNNCPGTGDVGGKLARVYFKVSGSGGPTNTPTPPSSPTPTTPASPSPTSTPLQGDINRDGTVNIQDYILLSNAFGTNNSNADLNGDDTVNIQDYIILSINFGRAS